jgi:putative ABC transport system permease protein
VSRIGFGFGGALGRVVRAGVGRRRVQTLVLVLSTMTAVTSAVLAVGLLVASRAPFDHAFSQQHGAHLAAQFDGAKATSAQLAATGHVTGVTAASGPYPTATVDQGTMNSTALGGVVGLPPMTLVGRADPGGPVDDLTLVDGHWVTGPGQAVLSASFFGPDQMVGAVLTFPQLPGSPRLTVVGVAQSVTGTADAWVEPAEIPALSAPDAAPAFQMLYRFASADTDAQIVADRGALVAALPAGALTGSLSYLNAKLSAQSDTAPIVPFMVAFGVLGLVMSVLIVGNVVSGSVGASLRRIGILKALGFTPAQVVRAYLAQALIPSAVGIGLGAALGNVLAIPLLRREDEVFGTPPQVIAPWIDVAAVFAALAVVAATAFAPALRAGRLRAVEAIALGRTPRAGRGRFVRRVLGRMPLPRAVGLGLASPFTRPARTLAVAAAVVFGAIAVTFAFGLASSLQRVQAGISRDGSADVTVDLSDGGPHSGGKVGPNGGGPAPAAGDPAAVAAAIAAQPGTRTSFGISHYQLTVSGVSGATTVELLEGDSTNRYELISGSWFTGPGQAVVPTHFLEVTGARIGSTITLTDKGSAIPVRIVGEVFDTEDHGMDVVTDLRTVSAVDPAKQSHEFDVTLQPGTSHAAYINALNAVLNPIGAQAQDNAIHSKDPIFILLDSMIAILTGMLVVVAGLAVLNTAVLETRERVHDLGVYKAVGMTPRQTIAMVLSSMAPIGLLAGIVGVPVGIALHDYVLPVMGHAAGTNLPHSMLTVYSGTETVLLGLGGLVIALGGAMLPASWAAATRTAAALRTE